MKSERYQHLTALAIATASLGSCDYSNTEPLPEAPVRNTPPSSEILPVDLELSPLTMTLNNTLCTTPRVKVSVPRELWGTDITSVSWSSRREGETNFRGDVELISWPEDLSYISRPLSVPADGRRMEQFDVKVEARGRDGNVVASDTESMEIGCVPIQPTPTPST